MDVVFRKLPPAESLVAQPGEIYLVPVPSAEAQRRILATYVLARGAQGLVRWDGPIDRIVVDIDPKLDDMLALSILQQQLQSHPLPAGLESFGHYAGKLRDGARPSPFPLEYSLEGIFLAMRSRIEKRLSDPSAGERFLGDWQRLADAILTAARQQIDPFVDPLFGLPSDAAGGVSVPLKSVFQGGPVGAGSEIAGFDFTPEIECLQKDKNVYRQDFDRAERGIVRPVGARLPFTGLILRHPRSAFLKYWTKTDCLPPIGGPYPFLAVHAGPGQWVFSVDPAQNVSLKALADALQAEEAKVDVDRATRDPWFDGANIGHVQIASPRGGTKLSDESIAKVLRKWGWVGATQSRSRGPIIAATLAVLALLAVGLFFLRPFASEDEASLLDIHDLYVLSVGVSEYNSPSVKPLRFADTDAEAIAAAFKKQEGGLFKKVVVKTRTNTEATRAEIIDYALGDWLLRQNTLTRNSLAVISFSGHGFVEPVTNRYQFAPYDYDPQNRGSSGIFLADVQRYLATLTCTSIILLDTCHSGASDESADDDPAPETLFKLLQKSMAQGRDQKGLVVMAACGRSQKANETTRWGHGALTLSILEGMNGKYLYDSKDLFATPLPRPNAQGVVNLKELDRYVTERVEVLSSEIFSPRDRRQFARSFSLGTIGLGQIPIAKRVD